jgi:hypothetical protein
MSRQAEIARVEQPTNGRAGFSGKSLLLMFVGGALTGAAVAYLAQRENRARIGALATHTREMAAQLPQAVREASHAAKEAFAEAYGGDGEAVAPKRKHHAV